MFTKGEKVCYVVDLRVVFFGGKPAGGSNNGKAGSVCGETGSSFFIFRPRGYFFSRLCRNLFISKTPKPLAPLG